MIVRVLKGLLSGGILATGVLVAVSQMAPLPQGGVPAGANDAPAPDVAPSMADPVGETAAPADTAPTADGADAPVVDEPLLDPPVITPAPDVATTPAPDGSALPQIAGAPEAGFDSAVPGVTADRLPAITAPDAGAPATDPAAEQAAPPAPDLPGTPVETITARETAAAPTAAGPLVDFARPFENPDQKPLFALVLVDTGEAGLDRANMAALPFPITFVIDPMAQGAADAAAIYRQAGQEVVMRATGIPAGATASDVEQSLQSLGQTLPEAVAYIDLDQGGFQDDPALAAAVVPAIGAQGRGVITFDRGLDSAQQVAQREKVPAAQVFRTLDASGETQAVIRRYLDRAAFKAAQEGAVIVLGQTRQDTLTTILQWSVEGRADSVALAPVSAILQRPTAP